MHILSKIIIDLYFLALNYMSSILSNPDKLISYAILAGGVYLGYKIYTAWQSCGDSKSVLGCILGDLTGDILDTADEFADKTRDKISHIIGGFLVPESQRCTKTGIVFMNIFGGGVDGAERDVINCRLKYALTLLTDYAKAVDIKVEDKESDEMYVAEDGSVLFKDTGLLSFSDKMREWYLGKYTTNKGGYTPEEQIQQMEGTFSPKEHRQNQQAQNRINRWGNTKRHTEFRKAIAGSFFMGYVNAKNLTTEKYGDRFVASDGTKYDINTGILHPTDDATDYFFRTMTGNKKLSVQNLYDIAIFNYDPKS